MRLAFAALALVSFLPLAVQAVTPDGAIQQVQSTAAFVAMPDAAGDVSVTADGLVTLAVTLRSGRFYGASVEGPGFCSADFPEAGPGDTLRLNCGYLRAGEYALTILVSGKVAAGSVHTTGATVST